MDAQEQKALDEMKTKIVEVKLSTFELMREYLRMDVDGLRNSGHKTVESALRSSMEHAVRDCKKLTDAFLRKYPDE